MSTSIYIPMTAEQNEVALQWIADIIWGDGRRLATAQALMIVRDGRLVAGFAYHNWDEASAVIEISGASVGPWCSRSTLYDIYQYAFNYLGCQMVVQRNRAEDGRLNRILERYGFEGQLVKRLLGRDKDCMLYTLTREAWMENGYHDEQHRKYEDDKKRAIGPKPN